MIDINDVFAWQNGFARYPEEPPSTPFASSRQYAAGWQAAYNATMTTDPGPSRDVALLTARLDNLTEVCRHLLHRVEWLEQDR